MDWSGVTPSPWRMGQTFRLSAISRVSVCPPYPEPLIAVLDIPSKGCEVVRDIPRPLPCLSAISRGYSVFVRHLSGLKRCRHVILRTIGRDFEDRTSGERGQFIDFCDLGGIWRTKLRAFADAMIATSRTQSREIADRFYG